MSNSCCPPGSWPKLATTLDSDNSAAGTLGNLDGLDVYSVAPPSNSTSGVLFIYDVHGFSGARVKSVCDALAMNGFHVCMPDVYGDSKGVNDFGGFGSPEGAAFLKQFTVEDLAPKFDKAIAHLKSKGCTDIGAVGFCWGAWAVWELSATGKLKAGAACHPSLAVGKMLFDKEVSDIAAAVKCPQLLLPASNDPSDLKEGGETVQVVRDLGLECKTIEYPEMQHGWVIRGDATQANVARDVESAITEVSSFFAKYLKAGGEAKSDL